MRRLPALGRQRRVLDRLLRRRGTSAFIPRRGEGVHDLRPLLLLADGVDLPEPRVHARGAVVRDDGQHAAAAGRHRPASRTRRSSPRSQAKGVSNRYFFTDLPVVGAVGRARRWRARARSQEYYAALRGGHAARALVRRPARSTARSRAPRATSTRTATCAPARRSWPTSCTRSWSRRSGSAARCSSSTTSGAGSSTTSRPPRVPDDRNDRRHQQGLRADGLPDPGGRGLAVRAARPRRPHDLRLRVDPEDDPLPLRARAADAARRVRAQHRALVRLRVEAAARPAATCPPRPT